ncbi:mandelate racemase/muconate lactonizing enzyme family protein [Halanaerobium kushneri]|uniref:Dipeptide epimerase n=1 Tax=Halanaerobium kushneri TaxID=56779 RepID=A0A1N6QS26_9FIRM|nr:dipeptide epimerase [Halanaerobium kushneri]SIQ19387.1 o-succinylbenzoate synthase [Halanaerobium kushneri]
MKIKDLKVYYLKVPLKKEFKTSLRTVKIAEEIIVEIETDTGDIGYGEAAPTAVITGDINSSISGIIQKYIRPKLIGESIGNIEKIHFLIEESAVNNNSAKAAVEMAVYDLFAQKLDVPLYKILGGYRNSLNSDLSISVNSPAQMKVEALQAVSDGYQVLKLKVGKDYQKDLDRFRAVRNAVGKNIKIRLDANQGWQPKEAVSIIRAMEAENLKPELIEQPVKADDYQGLKFVRDSVLTPIMADESLFSARDCLHLLKMQACDLINIKLMKAGGIYNALKINAIAEAYGIEVMLGSMLEAKVSVTAAAHLAAAKKNITRLDLDAPLYLAEDPVEGGIILNGRQISFPDEKGLGIRKLNNLIEIK